MNSSHDCNQVMGLTPCTKKLLQVEVQQIATTIEGNTCA